MAPLRKVSQQEEHQIQLLIVTLTCFDGYRSKYPHETFLWLSIQKLDLSMTKI